MGLRDKVNQIAYEAAYRAVTDITAIRQAQLQNSDTNMATVMFIDAFNPTNLTVQDVSGNVLNVTLNSGRTVAVGSAVLVVNGTVAL